MTPGQLITVHCNKPHFTETGIELVPYDREATFVEMAPKPWYPDACIVDYGNGPRKCVLTMITPR